MKLLHGSDKSTVAYRKYGSGPRLITVLHSLALDGTWYEPLAEALGEQYTLLAPDFRGHGQSQLGTSPVSLALVAADIAAMWDAEGIDSSVIMGISLGGMVAQAVTGSYPHRVPAQILMATRGAFDEAAAAATSARGDQVEAEGGLQAAAETTMYRWFGEKSKDPDQPLVRKARAQFLGAGGKTIGSYFRAMTKVGDFALQDPPATLVVGGDDDQSTPRPALEELAASIKGAQLDFARGGHLVAFENPASVAAVISPFLDALPVWEQN